MHIQLYFKHQKQNWKISQFWVVDALKLFKKKIKYYNNIRANNLLYFNVNDYFITIIHYLNN